MQLDELKKIIEGAGIVGAGGGGFPTHLKLDARADVVILNCAECEPLLGVDKFLLANFAGEILAGLDKVARVLGARGIVAVKESYGAAISAVEAQLENFYNISIHLLGDFYPAGDEIQLVYEAAGVIVPPGGLPIEAGCIVLNTETVYNIYHALDSGAAVTKKWLTVAGEVEKSATICVDLGTPIAAIAVAAEIKIDNPAIISGGPMMGRLVAPGDIVTKTTKGVIVLPDDHILVRNRMATRTVLQSRAASACCQCATCTSLCPRRLLGWPISPHRIMLAVTVAAPQSSAFAGALYCSQCGICETVACPQSLSPRRLIGTFKSALAEGGIKPAPIPAAPVWHGREERKVAMARLKERLDLDKYEGEGD